MVDKPKVVRTARDQHDVWVAAFTSALGESAVKAVLLSQPATNHAVVMAASQIAELAMVEYQRYWEQDDPSTHLGMDAVTQLVAALRAGLRGHYDPPPSIHESKGARQQIRRCLRLLGANDRDE